MDAATLKYKLLLFGALIVSVNLLSCGESQEKEEQEEIPEFMALDTSYYMHEADSLIKLTFDTLSKTLKAKIDSEGPADAVSFCQVNAYPLTGTHESEFIYVRRTSLKPRNPGNTPTPDERKILEEWQSAFDNGNTPGYGFYTEPGKVHVMKPIFIQPLCLKCHGKPDENIEPGTLAKIDSLYSLDKAKGYAEKDLRGAWHITFFVKEEQ